MPQEVLGLACQLPGALQTDAEIARQQQAKSLELRVASSLARLWKKRDKDAEARDLLQPIIQWFPEDLAFADLKKARSLLTGLISV